MDLTFTASETAFREDLRTWLTENPAGQKPSWDDGLIDWLIAWQRRLYDAGWAAVQWPTEHGGRGATLTESAIFFEEMARADAPLPINALGILLAGPTLMQWGTEEQQQRFLAPILSGEELWCQGFSEPEAGSDLAALKTRAVRDGDAWVVTGQKVWTSIAQFSRRCMLVARTDPESVKHRGLTYFALDMHSRGVTVRPLRQITGEPEFNELFLEEVRIPDADVVGPVGGGWKVALTTLANERSGLAFYNQVEMRKKLDRLIAELRDSNGLSDPLIQAELAELHVRTEILRLTAYRVLASIEKYGQAGPEGSLTKWMWSETNQRLMQFASEALGLETLAKSDSWSYELLRSRGNTIEGGTTEILKNIVAERVLGLPKGR
jgi:alkylation response protein AidB-like acyl-CoA dehydrogenase